MTPAVLYARYSPRPEAEECDSVEKQIERCRAYCNKQGYAIVKEFSDKNMSGGRADNRPGLQAAIRETIKHKATLVVYSRDRLARENADDADIVRRLIRAGADLESVTEPFDIKDEAGELMGGMLAVWAQYQRRQIQKRTSKAMRKYQAEGRRMTRMDRCPYGWRPDPNDPKRLIEDSDEQAIMSTTIQVLRLQGKGPRAIARSLNDAGQRCRGQEWSHSAVRSILRRNGPRADAS
jgi:site-specific DNA recombinase